MSANFYEEAWKVMFSALEAEYKALGKEDEFKLWFNLTYEKDTINSITVTVASQFLWDKMQEKGNIERIKDEMEKLIGLRPEINPVIQNNFASLKDGESEKEEKKSPLALSNGTLFDLPERGKNAFDPTSSRYKETSLSERYTFDSFIPGNSLQFVYKAALSVAENPGVKVNPILLYGGVGLGKTHLMQAIGNKMFREQGEKFRIRYVQAESFLNEFTYSLFVAKAPSKFQNKYRKLDALLIDDIQFLQKKEAVQSELFYTFEALHKNNAQMIFTCDRPLREIESMAERLVSRLGSGMCLDLQPPSAETRKAILYKKLEILHRRLADDVVEYIASTVETNVRDLEAALTKILGYEEFLDKAVTVEIASRELSNLYSSPHTGNISVQNIRRVVAENYNVSVDDLKSKKRNKKFVLPRHIAMYIMKEETELTLTEIGSEFGGRDHTSVMHALEKIKEQLSFDGSFRERLDSLVKEIRESK